MTRNNRSNRNFAIAYFVLVALPVLGLLGVLRNGRSLTAPVSVDGVWKLRANPGQLAALPCGNAVSSLEDTALTISQSGRNFTLEFANVLKTRTSGVIDGTSLVASMPPADAGSATGSCGSGWLLTANVNPKADPRLLAGTLSVADCPSCMPVEFQAVRQAPPAKKGAH